MGSILSPSNKTRLCDLNEDCLYEVVKHLDIDSLCELYNVREQFRNVINKVVVENPIIFKVSQYYEGNHFDKLSQISKFLEMFGGRVKQLKIDLPAHYEYEHYEAAKLMSTDIEALIENYCTNGNVKHFAFSNLELTDEFIDNNARFFNALESIEMDVKQIETDELFDIMPMLNMAKKIKILTRDNRDVNDFLRNINLNQVENLEIIGVNSTRHAIKINHLPVSPSVKRLKLPYCGLDPAALVQKFPNLEYLEYGQENFEFSLSPLVKLSSLNGLSLLYGENNKRHVFAFLIGLASQNSLETLKLTEISSKYTEKTWLGYDEMEMKFVKSLKKLKHLKALSLNTEPNFLRHLEEIAENLKELQRFEWDCTFIETEIFSQTKEFLLESILQFVRKAKKLVELKLMLEIDDMVMHDFFRKLTKIRKRQKSKKILNVVLIEDVDYKYIADVDEKPHRGKYVQLSRVFVSEECEL